jgi:hypothetical protein
MAYDLEIVIKRGAMPFRITGINTATRVKEITESFLAAWGIPLPDKLRRRGQPTIADSLAETGDYRHDEADYRIIAKRSA